MMNNPLKEIAAHRRDKKVMEQKKRYAS